MSISKEKLEARREELTEGLQNDNIRMGAGGVPYKVQSEPKKDEVISEVLEVNPNKMEEKKKPKKEDKKDEIV